MLTLAFESSAKAASVALCDDGRLIAQYFQASGLTHSRTLLPMAEDLLKNTEHDLSDVGLLAVAHGPGSFTGIRIGVSTVKGLGWGGEAMAWAGASQPEGTVICGCMDARRSQVYNALFKISGGRPVRSCPDRAISLDDLEKDIKNIGNCIFLVGDGAQLCYNHLQKISGPEIRLAPEGQRLQSAWGVAMAAMDKKPGTSEALLPVYLRLSQAERERQARGNK